MKEKIGTLTGKWSYEEDYGYGVAKGELLLRQEGNTLKGKIIFAEIVNGEQAFMIQEYLQGEVKANRVYLNATEYDIIHSTEPIDYELDSWNGILVAEDIIEGESIDDQGIVGYFSFRRIKENRQGNEMVDSGL